MGGGVEGEPKEGEKRSPRKNYIVNGREKEGYRNNLYMYNER